MNKRINSLLNKALDGSMNFHTTPTAYSREDLFLSPVKMSSKRLSEYMANQTPLIFEESRLPAFLSFDGSVWSHSLLITGTGERPDPLNITVSTHTFDADDRPLYTYTYSACRLLHILGGRE